MEGQDPEDSKQNTADMTAFVQNLLVQMQNRFQAMSENIITKIDEMGSRIDELEQSIDELKVELGTESMPTKSSPEEAKSPKSPDT
ncbi:Heat shock factor-binding protein 1 [Zostera marina]|uniref:Heat shock factor-binding protein 1 n=1 Tax=Zostera marina TaxID=29655 RepID=A0A0K9PTZ0_ZOSMR|nr:Heat shock factor-binding protein 1 [Zostera marina]